jgi:hypothetical protein
MKELYDTLQNYGMQLKESAQDSDLMRSIQKLYVTSKNDLQKTKMPDFAAFMDSVVAGLDAGISVPTLAQIKKSAESVVVNLLKRDEEAKVDNKEKDRTEKEAAKESEEDQKEDADEESGHTKKNDESASAS